MSDDLSQIGMGVLMNMLGGNKETVDAVKDSQNKKLSEVRKENDTLILCFDDGTALEIFDGGQSCCEYRHMVIDDDLSYFAGAVFTGISIKDYKDDIDGEDAYGNYHEMQFVEVTTDKGSFTFVNHNEHNGYYGGFWLEARLRPKDE